MIFLLLICLFSPWVTPLAHTQQPGFSAAEDRSHLSQLTGRWLNEFTFAQAAQTPRVFWQSVELFADGSMAHAYFSRDPRRYADVPYTRIVSTWQAGVFVDPQKAKGAISVIRLQPSEQINYDKERARFQHISGNFGPQFRRFSLSVDGGELTLSELVVLEVPGNILISFPSDARDMVFQRQPNAPSSISRQSWAQIKRAKIPPR